MISLLLPGFQKMSPYFPRIPIIRIVAPNDINKAFNDDWL